jgi:histidinol-phosphate phosphatase family protein
MSHRAVFLDRDGTLVDDPGYLRDPTRVALLPGAAAAVRKLADAGFRVVVVTNQSGIARGVVTLEEYERVAARVVELLAAEGAALDAVYMCPHHPEKTGRCDCRKPAVGSYRRAAKDLDIDLARSIWIGDRMTDLEPARAFGGRAILVLTGLGARVDDDLGSLGMEVAPDLARAADRVLAED